MSDSIASTVRLAPTTVRLKRGGDGGFAIERSSACPRVGTRTMHRYIDRIIRLTILRRDVRLAFLRTMHMLDAPSALFAPRMTHAILTTRLTSENQLTSFSAASSL